MMLIQLLNCPKSYLKMLWKRRHNADLDKLGIWFSDLDNFFQLGSKVVKSDSKIMIVHSNLLIRDIENVVDPFPHLQKSEIFEQQKCFPVVNFINILRTIFLYECHFGSFSLVTCTWKKLPKRHLYELLVRKIRTWNVDEIDTWIQMPEIRKRIQNRQRVDPWRGSCEPTSDLRPPASLRPEPSRLHWQQEHWKALDENVDKELFENYESRYWRL